VGTNITNTIEFTVDAVIRESFESIPFDSNLFKEILKANRTYEKGEIHIHKNGLIWVLFSFDNNTKTEYYLVRRQENN
jgi:hypothetical protein